MKDNEDLIIKLALKSEGGYTNDKADPGGPTNWGITIKDARMYWKANATAADVKAMPLSAAISIYDKHYWDPMRCDEIPSGMDYVVLDYGLNSGIARPPRVLQKILGLPASDRISTALIDRVKSANQEKLIDAVCDERLHFMHQIRGGTAWATFGKGWGTRVASVRKTAKDLNKQKKATPAIVELHPAAETATPKATYIDPNLPTKITVSTTTATAGGSVAAQTGTHEWMTTLIVAGVAIVVVGGIGYLIYRNQHKKQITVELPPGMRPLA